MKSRLLSLSLITAAMLALMGGPPSFADDGEKVVKRMTGGSIDNQLMVLPETVGQRVSHSEHAFTDMMNFYVPSQAASGLLTPVIYNNIDLTLVEELLVAKPLINVFIYGPAVEVPDTAFAHSFMDTFAAMSLDDGVTWKTINLSQTASLSSFVLGQNPTSDSTTHDLPSDHTIIEREDGEIALHAPGLEYPYTNQCTTCHGVTLLGGKGPSCYSCHGVEWTEKAPDGALVLYIEEVEWDPTGSSRAASAKKTVLGKLEVEGGGAAARAKVTLINSLTKEELASTRATKKGDFKFEVKLNETPPCAVSVVSGKVTSYEVAVRDDDGDRITECIGLANYPGGTYNVIHATAGNKVLVAWPSRFCQQGQPGYSFAWDGDDTEMKPELVDRRDALEAYLGIEVAKDLYLTDLFGVGGSQGSIDFGDEGYPQAGEVPFGCVWTARGVLLPGDDPRTTELESSYMVWTKPERLTSGRRDPNRIEVAAVRGAGFVITWQEDPDGLRPGQGEGPGEGWSGAVAHDKTDVWYSFIRWEHFDVVEAPLVEGALVPEPINVAEHDLAVSGRPQVYVPMAVPMRLTNNDKCKAEEYGPGATVSDPKFTFSYCNGEVAADYGLQDFCAATVDVPQGKDDALGPICVNAAGLPNIANTGSTRPRTSLQGYVSNSSDGTISAWVIVAAEESKGLGRYLFLPDGNACPDLKPGDTGYNPDCTSDEGKNQWYFSFDMGAPQTSSTMGEANGLVQNLVSQGNMLNQPEVDWRTGNFYPVINTSVMWDFGIYNFDLYNTEIARRSSLLVQSIGKAKASSSKILATPSWKQGIMNQGGPADAMLRRIVLPADYVEGIAKNPYAFTNMQCENWLVEAGDNLYYPGGLCGDPATNLSSVVIDTCKDDSTGGDVPCPTVDFTSSAFGIGDTNPILQGYIQGEGNTVRALTWHQCPSVGAQTSGDFTAVTCDNDARTDAFVNLKDQSWYNPLDVAKGHRGFIDGDFVMYLYAWSPNWRLNAKGNDRYDLYVRRSFDGGQTWKTTPGQFLASDGFVYGGDGTVTCETYRSTDTQASGTAEPRVCYTYGAGGDEQARNVTQHSRMKTTTLDPRYAPTPATILSTCVSDLGIDATVWTCDDDSKVQDTDMRNPSRYFMVYETGDNNTVVDGEAEPLDLFYSRAEDFGDDYVVWAETDTANPDATLCYPSNAHGDAGIIGSVVEGSGFCNEFDRMNARGDTHSSEANLEANPDGSKLYGVWAQWVYENDDYAADIIESDAMARRIWWIDDYISENLDNVWTIPGTNSTAQ